MNLILLLLLLLLLLIIIIIIIIIVIQTAVTKICDVTLSHDQFGPKPVFPFVLGVWECAACLNLHHPPFGFSC